VLGTGRTPGATADGADARSDHGRTATAHDCTDQAADHGASSGLAPGLLLDLAGDLLALGYVGIELGHIDSFRVDDRFRALAGTAAGQQDADQHW
jgi:hypothetical protein